MSSSVFSSTQSLMQMFDGKVQEFMNDIENVHMVWLEEIQQEANRMFSSDFSAEPELMPKTPSQKKTSRRKRISLEQDGNRRRRCSRGKRGNLRRSSVNKMILIAEDEGGPGAVSVEVLPEEPKHSTCKNQQSQSEVAEEIRPPSLISCEAAPSSVSVKNSERNTQIQENNAYEQTETEGEYASTHPHTSSKSQKQMPEAMVKLSAADRLSAEMLIKAEPSPGRSVTKIAIAGAASSSSRRSSVRHSLTLRRSLAGLRHSMTRESVRRASRSSFLKKKASVQNVTSSTNVCEDVLIVSDGEDVAVKDEGALSEKVEDVDVPLGHTEASADVKDKSLHAPNTCFTRSMAQSTPTMVPSVSIINKAGGSSPDSEPDGTGGKPQIDSSRSLKRQAVDAAEDFQSPRKKPSPPKKSHTAIKPNMRSFLHTVQKNQLLMMTPSSLGRSNVMKSFIKHATPHKVDHAKREQLKLEALKKKQEQEEERMRKMEEDKKRRQEEMKRKRDERLRRVVEARVKEEQSKEEKKKKIEQKMAQIDEKNDKLREERLAEEKAKKKVATKRQEELEQRRKLEEETRKKKIQQAEEEEKRLLELQAKRRAEEEQERARKLAEARRAMELKKEQDLERKRLAAAERERMEQEKALALQREIEKAAREKEIKELEEKRKELEERRIRKEQERQAEEQRVAKLKEAAAAAAAAAAKKALPVEIQHAVLKTPLGKGPGLNVTVDMEGSPQSYDITPKGGNKPVVVNTNPEDYGMDQNSDDSTDDESAPRKPIPSWAEGLILKQSMMKQYFNPMDLHYYFGEIEPLKLENIFYKSKPRYFKRTSSAVWHSPPRMGTLPF